MKFYKDFKVNEGAFILKEILEVMYVSESISLPPYIYRKVINLPKALCDYLEGGYPDIDMDDNHLVMHNFLIILYYDPQYLFHLSFQEFFL